MKLKEAKINCDCGDQLELHLNHLNFFVCICKRCNTNPSLSEMLKNNKCSL